MRVPFDISRSRPTRGLAALSFVLALTVGASAAAAEASAPPVGGDPKPPSVTVVAAEIGPIVETAVVTGTLRPKEEILVNAEIDGLAVVEILVEEGDRVEKGQPLARLSSDTVDVAIAQADAQIARAEASIAQARTQIVQAEASLKQAQNAFTRAEQLRKTGTASVQTFETREMEADVAASKVNEAKQALALAVADKSLAEAQKREQLVRLRRTDIKAPASGLVSRRTARLGAVASTSGDALFRIIEDGAVELEADVAETTLANLAVGQPAEVVPAGRERPVAGRIRLISPEIDVTTRLGQVRIALDTAAGLTIGAFAYGIIETARDEGVLVPLSAVLYEADHAEVMVVVDGTVETRTVTVGLVSEGRAEIKDGVAAGEQVVSIAGTFLRGGDRVNPVLAAR